MPIHDRVYRRLETGDRGGATFPPFVIARYGARYATHGWFTKLLIFGSFVPCVIVALIAYGLTRNEDRVLELLMALSQGVYAFGSYEAVPTEIWTTLGKSILMVMFVLQGVVAIALTPLVGGRVIADDLRTQAFEIYLSRPLNAFEYALGKLLVVVRPLLLVTALPALFMLGLTNVLLPESTEGFLALYPAALLAGALMSFVNAGVILGISSLGKSRRSATITWLLLTMGSWVVQGTLLGRLQDPAFDVVGYQANVWIVVQSLIAFEPPEALATELPFVARDRGPWASVAVLAALFTLSMAHVVRRATRGSLG